SRATSHPWRSSPVSRPDRSARGRPRRSTTSSTHHSRSLSNAPRHAGADVAESALVLPPGLGAADTAAETAAAVPQPEEAQVVGRNVRVMAVAQLITWTMTLLWTLVVPRSLGPTGMGTIMA